MYGGNGLPDWLKNGAQWQFAQQHMLKFLLLQIFLPILVMVLLTYESSFAEPLFWIGMLISIIPSFVMIMLVIKAGKSPKYWKGYLQSYIDFYQKKGEEGKEKIEIANLYLQSIA